MERVLLVEDDRTMALALSVRLRHAGMEVLICHDAHEASYVALHERPHVLLLDIDMPGFTGLELHECLNLGSRGRNISVIYVTGSPSKLHRQIAFQQGAKAFLHKPFESSVLIDTIRKVARSAGATNS